MNVDVPPCSLGSSQHSFMKGSRVCIICWWAPRTLTQPVSRRRRKSDLDKVLEFWGTSCVFCRALATTRDHLIPRSRGGSDSLHNLRPCCKRCNASKADATPFEWLMDECPAEFRELVAPLPRAPDEVRRAEAQVDREARRVRRVQRRESELRYLARLSADLDSEEQRASALGG